MLIPPVLGSGRGLCPKRDRNRPRALGRAAAQTRRRRSSSSSSIGLANLKIADRVTLGNMCPEYGATAAMFPIDEMTLDYLTLTGRTASHVKLVEAYAKAQGLFREAGTEALYDDTIELDLGLVEPSLAGPKRPQDRVSLTKAKIGSKTLLRHDEREERKAVARRIRRRPSPFSSGRKNQVTTGDHETAAGLEHGAVVVAATRAHQTRRTRA